MPQGIWERNRESVQWRVAALERAVLAVTEGGLDQFVSRDGRIAAHTLAGSLGMFGFHRAAAAAAELEDLLSSPGTASPARASGALALMRADLAGDPCGGQARPADDRA